MASTKVKGKRQRRKRGRKLDTLRRQISETTDLTKRRQLGDKIRKISRSAPVPDR